MEPEVPPEVPPEELEFDEDGFDNDRDRRKESMQKASFAFGFDNVNYRTSGGLCVLNNLLISLPMAHRAPNRCLP